MKKYTVVKFFTDLQDNRHPYNVGDEFPRKGLTVNKERLAELSSNNNKQHKVLIVAEEKPDVPEELDILEEPIETNEKSKQVKKRRNKSDDN